MKHYDYVLGLDLGVASLGWALIEIDDNAQPISLLDAGVRCWDLNNNTAEDVTRGKEVSPNKERRDARLQRRQIYRRAKRYKKTFRILQELGLFDQGPRDSLARKAYIDKIDQQAKLWLVAHVPEAANDPWLHHNYVYRLRAAALDHPLPPELLGRVFYSLAQRRGFLSNRKGTISSDEKGVVKQAITQLEKDIQQVGARTLGEFLTKLNPHEQRIRGHYTSRSMYIAEFELIYNAQRRHYPKLLTSRARKLLYEAIFYQRPLKSQRSRVGRCELEIYLKQDADGKVTVLHPFRRAPKASLEAQRLRYMQRINDLEIISPDGEIRPLTAEERQKLYDLAEHRPELKFNDIRKALGLPAGKQSEWRFNLEAGGENKLPGNTTAARIRNILGDAWDSLGEKQKKLVDDLLAFTQDDALYKHLQKVWGFDAQTADLLVNMPLEEGFAAFSRRAIRRLLPLLEQGMRLNAAIKVAYGGHNRSTEVHDLLPPVREVFREINNPFVIRTMTQLRKIVNGVIRKHGKPARIHIELARELKEPRKKRKLEYTRQRQRQQEREEAAIQIRKALGREPKSWEIEKYLLAEECNWECPYTGRKVPGASIQERIRALFSEPSDFDVEHILPFSRSLDNSFSNKTLCYHSENRSVKQNLTPYEAYSHDPVRWKEILSRVSKFKGPYAEDKLKKFQLEEIPEDFAQRHLSDTRYASRLAADYLGLLYGGRVDAEGQQRVFTVSGKLTALVRNAWKLNSVLGSDQKNRNDLRNHAIDAIVIALASPSLLYHYRELARVLARTSCNFVTLDPPWESFHQDVNRRIETMIATFSPNRRMSGALHEETFYSLSGENTVTVRKALKNMSIHEVEKIVDPAIRAKVKNKLKALGKNDPKIFTDEKNLPAIRVRKKGSKIKRFPIKSARIFVHQRVVPIGAGHRLRYVIPGNNHHAEVYAILDANGNELKYRVKAVSLLEAWERKRKGKPIICTNHGPGTRFKCVLRKGDYIKFVKDNRLLRVVSVSDNYIAGKDVNDGRKITDIKKNKELIVVCRKRMLWSAANERTGTPKA